MSHAIKEVADVLGITLKHAKTKHAQTVGVLERPHASVNQAMNIEKGERRSFWHKYVTIAVLNYNKLYHSSIGCEPSTVFDGRTPSNVFDLETGIHPQEIPTPNSHIAQDVFERTEMIFQDVRKNAMQAHVKYKAYYDKIAKAFKPKQTDDVFVLQPKADHQGIKTRCTVFRSIGH